MRILSAIVAVAAVGVFASPAFAENEYYVVKNAGGGCEVVERPLGSPPSGEHSEKHLTAADAQAAMGKDPNCKK